MDIPVSDAELRARSGAAATASPPSLLPLALLCVFAVSTSATTAVVLAVLRAPFGHPEPWVFAGALVCLGGAVFAWWLVAERSARSGVPAAAGLPLAVLAALALPMLPGLLPVLFFPAALAFAALWTVGLARLTNTLRQGRAWQLLLACLLGVGAGAVYFLFVNGKGYANFLSPELALAGVQHRDTLFHAAIAEMVSRFGAVSTGLDGLVAIPYHFLSHLWLGAVGHALGLSAIGAYFVIPEILGVPLLLFLGGAAAWTIGVRLVPPEGHFLLVAAPLALLAGFEIWEWWAAYLVSESYLLALVLFLAGLPLLAGIATGNTSYRGLPGRSFEQPPPGTFILVVALLWALPISLAKLSVGYAWGAGLGFLAVWPGALTLRQRALILFGLALLAVLLLMLVPADQALHSELSPLHFVLAYPDGAWPSLAAIGLFALAATALSRAAPAEWLPLSALFGAMAAAVAAPALLLSIGGGSAYYFLNLGMWLAIVFLAVAGAWVAARARLARGAFIVVVLAALLATVAAPAKRASLDAPAELIARLEGALPEIADGDEAAGLRARLSEAAAAVANTELAQVAALIRTQVGERRDTLVFVSPAYAAFWRAHALCNAQPFIVPALFGLPMLKGLPPEAEGCAIGDLFGYPEYGPDARSAAASPEALCSAALARGFGAVLLIEGRGEGRLLPCR